MKNNRYFCSLKNIKVQNFRPFLKVITITVAVSFFAG